MVWKVAIIGGGPGGLGAAIALAQLNAPDAAPLVDWTLFEKKPRISETGGGISLQRNTWTMLEHFGVAERIDARDFFREPRGRTNEHRDAVTGVLLARTEEEKADGGGSSTPTPLHRVSCRTPRATLQRALLAALDPARIRVDARVVAVTPGAAGYRVAFADGTADTFDLVVGADGIRSVVRQLVAPGHALRYNGQSAYRTVVRASDVAAINGIPQASCFWQHVGGKYVFTSPLGRDDFEVTARLRPGTDPAASPEQNAAARARAAQASWGQPVDFHALLPHYAAFAPPLRAVLRLAADSGQTQAFALFNGPRLTAIVHTPTDKTDKAATATAGAGLALLGDASHPLSGAFGAGAGFAFEDAYTLARTLAWAHAAQRPLGAALALYDEVRSAHYANLYGALDKVAAVAAAVEARHLPLHEEVAERVRSVWTGKNSVDWVYAYRADEVIAQRLEGKE